jgi:demethylmenaquinone methyltransferase/2-methoxy-6-polyprenyl-1,4-benzoquinol methylase
MAVGEACGGRVVGVDFSSKMLLLASAKLRKTQGRAGQIELVAADAMRLPFKDGVFDACTAGFGIRNVRDVRSALACAAAALRPGGAMMMLEFRPPSGVCLRILGKAYLLCAMPAIAAFFGGNLCAYRYLARSIVSFATDAQMAVMMTEAGFGDIEQSATFPGVATIHVASR